jgi:hypothetical protein
MIIQSFKKIFHIIAQPVERFGAPRKPPASAEAVTIGMAAEETWKPAENGRGTGGRKPEKAWTEKAWTPILLRCSLGKKYPPSVLQK